MGAYLAAPKTEKVSVNDSLGDITYGASCMQGWRVTMEDAHCCLLDFDEKASLFGVYDGHGGSEVAEFVAKHLPKEILGTETYKNGSLKQSLIDAFLGIDQKLISEEGMNELKELAGVNDLSDAEEGEANLLSKEAEMPLEQLLEKLKQQGYESSARPVGMVEESEDEDEEDSDDYIDDNDDDDENGKGEGEDEADEQTEKQEQNGEVLDSKLDTIENNSSDLKAKTNGKQENGKEKETAGEEKSSTSSEGQQQDNPNECENKEEIEDDEKEDIKNDDDDEDGGDDDDDDDQTMSWPHSDEVGYDSGTTAIVALMKDKQLVVANVGDSRCVLCRSGVALDMSTDHKPDDDKELNRIKNAGGKVTCEGRVNGGLNLSRALGDHSYKLKSELPAHEQMISAFPDIRETTLTDSDEFMVIACDGIWNVMSSQEVVDFVADRLKKQKSKGEGNLTIICEELLDACLAPDTTGDGSGCDNMTCIIVLFKRQQSSSEEPEQRAGKRKGDEIENCDELEQSSKRIRSDQ